MNEFLEYPRGVYFIDPLDSTPVVLFTTAERVRGFVFNEPGGAANGVTFKSADGSLTYFSMNIAANAGGFEEVQFLASHGLAVEAVDQIQLTVFVATPGGTGTVAQLP